MNDRDRKWLALAGVTVAAIVLAYLLRGPLYHWLLALHGRH
jgi:hypothetical protein